MTATGYTFEDTCDLLLVWGDDDVQAGLTVAIKLPIHKRLDTRLAKPGYISARQKKYKFPSASAGRGTNQKQTTS